MKKLFMLLVSIVKEVKYFKKFLDSCDNNVIFYLDDKNQNQKKLLIC